MAKKVYVVMGNDYPQAVHATQAGADASIKARKKKDAEEVRKGMQHERFTGAGMVYWRSYEFELQD